MIPSLICLQSEVTIPLAALDNITAKLFTLFNLILHYFRKLI